MLPFLKRWELSTLLSLYHFRKQVSYFLCLGSAKGLPRRYLSILTPSPHCTLEPEKQTSSMTAANPSAHRRELSSPRRKGSEGRLKKTVETLSRACRLVAEE